MSVEDTNKLVALINENSSAEIASIVKNELNCLHEMVKNLVDHATKIDHRINGTMQSLQTLIDMKKGDYEK